MINVFQPTLGEEELAAIAPVFESNWLGRGPRTDEFEAAFARHLAVERPHVRSITSCTEGLFLAMELLGVEAGDEVVLPSPSFVGAGNAIAAFGATPVFCDVDPRTLNPTVEHVEAKLSPRTKAVMPLHYGGLPGDIAQIAKLTRDRGIFLVEDAACAVASRLDGTACGTFGDIGVWSFDAMKILVTGDGGMLYARDPAIAARLEAATYLGLETRSGLAAAGSADRWWEFEISSFSRRAILNDVTSAIGLVQLGKLPGFIERRRAIHERYDRTLADLEWVSLPPVPRPGVEPSYYFYWIQTSEQVRDSLAAHLRDRGIYTTFRYWPLHLVSMYGSSERLAGAETAARTTLCIPIHQGLTDANVDEVAAAVRDFGPSAALVA